MYSALGDPALAISRRAGIVGRVLSAQHLTPLTVATLDIERCPAARAASFFGKERIEGRDRIDLAST